MIKNCTQLSMSGSISSQKCAQVKVNILTLLNILKY